MVRKKKRKKIKSFIKAIIDYSEGKTPKDFRVFIINKCGKKREVIDLENETI